jgi:hypothetical protein
MPASRATPRTTAADGPAAPPPRTTTSYRFMPSGCSRLVRVLSRSGRISRRLRHPPRRPVRPTRFTPHNTPLVGLGCASDPDGWGTVDATGRTSVPGVRAAGNDWSSPAGTLPTPRSSPPCWTPSASTTAGPDAHAAARTGCSPTKANTSAANRRFLTTRGIKVTIPEREDQRQDGHVEAQPVAAPAASTRWPTEAETWSNAASTDSSNGEASPPATTRQHAPTSLESPSPPPSSGQDNGLYQHALEVCHVLGCPCVRRSRPYRWEDEPDWVRG